MEKEISNAIKIEKSNAEKIRIELFEKNIIRNDLKIFSENNFIYLPIKNINNNSISKYKIYKFKFEKQNIKLKSYKDIISLSDELKKFLPNSYDVIGNIILIKLKDETIKYKKEIGNSLLKTNKNIKTVCSVEPVKGELRTRDIEIIAGEKLTDTIHIENKLKFYIDVEKTYFSPRLANERIRIAELVKNDETVIDLFAGVAPFSITIAKYANPKIIYAIDKNKFAIDFAERNIKLNKVLDKVLTIRSDAKNIEDIIKKYNINVNRVIMNLPFNSYNFFEDVMDIILEKCIIHYYEIINEDNITNRIDELKRIALKKNIILKKLKIIKIKSYSPHEFYICIDITAEKQLPT